MGAQEADGLEAEAEGPDFEDVDDAADSINDFETEGGEEDGPADAASKRQKHEQAGKDGETARAHEITRANFRQLEDGVAVQVLCAQDGESAGTWLEAKALRVESAGVVVKCVYPCVPSWEAVVTSMPRRARAAGAAVRPFVVYRVYRVYRSFPTKLGDPLGVRALLIFGSPVHTRAGT